MKKFVVRGRAHVGRIMRSAATQMAILGGSLVFGCAQRNEGQVDYAVATPGDSGIKNAVLAYSQDGNQIWGLDAKYTIGTASENGQESTDPAVIPKGETISVKLLQFFVKHFEEGTEEFLVGLANSHGEIALIIKCEDRGNTTSSAFEQASADHGRVVYYTEDMRHGQMANLSGEPFYGPLEYTGQPFLIDILIMELDQEEVKQFHELFKRLAKLGGTAYPPASPVLSVLESISDAIVASEQDDVDMRYRLHLWPTNGATGLPTPIVREGNYVVLRQEDRSRPFDWSKVRLNPYDGRLYWVADGSAFRDETYLVFQIQKGLDPTKLRDEQTLTVFMKAYLTARVGEVPQSQPERSVQPPPDTDELLRDVTSFIRNVRNQ